jgi:hypothetical protein
LYNTTDIPKPARTKILVWCKISVARGYSDHTHPLPRKSDRPSRFQEAIAQNSIDSINFYSDFVPDIFHPHYPLCQGVLGSKYLN